MSYLYIVRVYEGEEVFDYEYSNLKHATEHFNADKAERVELIEYCWNSQAATRTYKTLDSKTKN